MESIQKYLDEKYPDLKLRVSKVNPPIISGRLGYSCGTRGNIDSQLLGALLEVKDLVEESIDRVKLNLGKKMQILGIDVVQVGCEYWANATAISSFWVMEEKEDHLCSTGNHVFYKGQPIIYKSFLD